MKRIKVWRDNTMVVRSTIFWLIVHLIVMTVCSASIILCGIMPVINIYGQTVKLAYTIPVCLVSALVSAWNFADELRFLKGGCKVED